MNEIRCPYCRKKQIGILPYYDELGLKKIYGVNCNDPSFKYNSKYNSKNIHNCKFQIPNLNFDIKKPETDTNKKFVYCNSVCTTKILLYNKENPLEPINYGDDKYYCYLHKKEMIKQYKLQEKEKEKEMKKLQKAQLKAEKMKAKEEEKAIKQKAKQDAKIVNKKIITENIVLGPSIIENQKEVNGCVQILKTGTNKGSVCGCKIVSENMCKRHYLLLHKEIIINN
jgi:hypothetical protein